MTARTDLPIKILHVEDNPDDVELLQLELRRTNLNFDVVSVASKKEFERVFASEFDVVVTDYNLKDFNGLSAIRWIRERDPIIPILLFSGTVGEELAVDLLQAGANDFVLKSNIKKIPNALEKAISQGLLERESIRIQKEILEKNLLLDSMFNAFEDFVFLKDPSGKFLKVNQPFSDFLELREEEIIGKVNADIFKSPTTKDDEYDELVVRSKKKVTYEVERMNRRGQKFIFEIWKKPVLSDGRVTGILGHARNVTEKRELLEIAERSEFGLNQAERIAGFGSFEYNSETDIITGSGNFSSLLGLDGYTISLRKFANLVKVEDRPLFMSGITEAIEEKKEYFQEHRFLKSDGVHGQFKILFRPDHRENKSNLFYGTLIDNDSQHLDAIYLVDRLERDRKDIARELHDNLGQKLNAISMFISKISDNYPNEKELQRVREFALEAIDDLGRLLTNISVKQVEEHSLEYAIEKLLSYFPDSMSLKKEIKLHDEKLSNFIKAQLYRVTQEALNNILKYSKATEVSLTIKLTGSIVDLNIIDNGIGFNVQKAMGGNGLTNMTHRVKNCNGLISIESAVGKGTWIKIKMPIN